MRLLGVDQIRARLIVEEPPDAAHCPAPPIGVASLPAVGSAVLQGHRQLDFLFVIEGLAAELAERLEQPWASPKLA